jgi:uncharacterized LabA/DUF88 family protein
MPTDPTSFIIDGFNLYHSAVAASKDLAGASTKWLNIRALCESYLPNIGRANVSREFYYFSALAHHRTKVDPDTVARHQSFIDCLADTGVVIQLANFKEKQIWCGLCENQLTRHEEKETDVAIAVKLIELFATDRCDTAILVTGDTDIAPAVRYVKQYYPHKRVGFLFPYRRKNKELLALGTGIKMSKEKYVEFQFPNTVILKDGRSRTKPIMW